MSSEIDRALRALVSPADKLRDEVLEALRQDETLGVFRGFHGDKAEISERLEAPPVVFVAIESMVPSEGAFKTGNQAGKCLKYDVGIRVVARWVSVDRVVEQDERTGFGLARAFDFALAKGLKGKVFTRGESPAIGTEEGQEKRSVVSMQMNYLFRRVGG